MRYIIIITVLFLIPLVAEAQYDVKWMAVTSGFQVATNGSSLELLGIAGQAFADSADSKRSPKAGLFYIQESTAAAAQRTILTVPEVVHAVGDTFEMDVSFAASCLLFRIPVERAWTLHVSFNKTVLEPLEYDSIAEDADRYTITLRGNAGSETTLLTRLRFLARLGNDSVTDVRVESFSWSGGDGLPLTSLPGKVTLRGLCTTYGNTRLLSTRASAAINVAPNPITNGRASFQLYASEPTVGHLVITDLQGNIVVQRDNVQASPDWPITQVEFHDVAAGTFAAMLITPQGIGRATLLILP